jgi:hypothetical protein
MVPFNVLPFFNKIVSPANPVTGRIKHTKTAHPRKHAVHFFRGWSRLILNFLRISFSRSVRGFRIEIPDLSRREFGAYSNRAAANFTVLDKLLPFAVRDIKPYTERLAAIRT